MFIIRLKQLRMVFFLSFFKFLSKFKKTNHWIIGERGNEARDNGYSFYRYMKENHPEQKVYFLITKDSKDFEKVKEDAVFFNSVKSFWLVVTAKKIVSAHYAAVLPQPVGTKIFHLFKLYKNFYFLQHGVIKDDLKSLYAVQSPMKLFVCGAKPEFDDVSKNYGHPKGVVRYTGLARFDYLHNLNIKKQILIMPTWRSYIKSKEQFLESTYFYEWQKLLLDKKLNEFLKVNKIRLLFYVHYEMQKYADLFKTISENVIIAKFNDYDVQKLLRDSALLITDFSSVFFDFGYMRKPVIYYHFDKYHYNKGYFDYTTMGFGDITRNNEEVVEKICESAGNEFEMNAMFKSRAEKFFPLFDQNNCKRIYQVLLENEQIKI